MSYIHAKILDLDDDSYIVLREFLGGEQVGDSVIEIRRKRYKEGFSLELYYNVYSIADLYNIIHDGTIKPCNGQEVLLKPTLELKKLILDRLGNFNE